MSNHNIHNLAMDVILNSINSLNQFLDKKIPIELGDHTPLYGSLGVLDSLSLVSLIVAIEEGIEDEFGIEIILASEKAMSQTKSPFSTVGSLVGYIQTLIKEDAADV